jgi:glycosyltransferase involved in cell wall biosynthesis
MTRIAAGIVAYNDEPTVGNAVRSLLDQRLPTGVDWNRIWVVASGCTDRTVARVREIEAADPRVRLVEEPIRRGKAAALAEVLARAEGDAAVLLNGDARAAPDAVAKLLGRADEARAPFAVMARPVPDLEGVNPRFAKAIEFFWQAHHQLHQSYFADGGSTHLSDEMLLVSLDPRPPLAPGIVNDGAFVGAWLRKVGGRAYYAPESLVYLRPARDLSEHLRQRRRIRVGHRQTWDLVSIRPTTLSVFARVRPREALAAIRAAYRTERTGVTAPLVLAMVELLSAGLAAWDRLRPASNYVLWTRISARTGTPERRPAPVARTSRSPKRTDGTG